MNHTILIISHARVCLTSDDVVFVVIVVIDVVYRPLVVA